MKLILKLKLKSIKIPEGITILVLFFLAILTFFLAKNNFLTPFLMGICLSIHIVMNLFSKFKDSNVSPSLHFNRPLEGTLKFSMYIIAFEYYFTLIFDSENSMGVIRAQMCVTYTYMILLWVIFAGISIIGFYSVFSVVRLWFPYFVRNVDIIQSPFILYLAVIFIALMSFGSWYTFFNFLTSALFKKEDYGLYNKVYLKFSYWIIPISLFVGIMLIIFENRIFSICLSLISA